MPRKPDPKSKAGFVRSLPSTLSAAEVVANAKAAGVKLDAAYVYAVRTNVNKKASGKEPKPVRSMRPADGSHYLVVEIERMAERKFVELLTAKLNSSRR
jgi:hypothetical protein